MHATLQQMRLFEAVARLGSVTKAAAEAHLTQPAVSIQIKRLEENAQISLFDQVGRKLYLTAAGRLMLESSRKILDEMSTLGDNIEAMRGEVAGTVRVSAVTTAQYFLPYLLGEFVRQHPRVQPLMTVTNRDTMVSRLQNYQDDLYIMGHVPEGMDVVRVPFLEDKLVVVAHPDHPLTKQKNVPLKALLDEHMLVREKGSGTRQAKERLLAEHGLKVTPFMELGSGVALKQGVMAGLGVAVLSQHSIHLELALGRIALIDMEAFPLHRPWYAVHQANRQPSLATRTFLDFLENEGAKVVSDMSPTT